MNFKIPLQVQVEIFRILHRHSLTKFFLVGDPCQSIFGFAGFRVELLHEFSNEINASGDFPLNNNFRCSRLIVTHANKLLPRTPPMVASGDAADEPSKPIYVHCENCFEAITDYFLPTLEELKIPLGKAVILAPWWIKLYN